MTPKLKRNILRIIPFGLIWWVTGMVFILVELAAMDGGNTDPDSIITMNFSVWLFASVSVFFVGTLVGAMELLVLEKMLKRFSFTVTIFYKLIIYLILMMILIILVYPVAASLESGTSLNDPEVMRKTANFLISDTLLSTLLQMFFSILLSVVYAGISENIGYSTLINLLSGKYHRPVEENRIFMFLDMKSSTTHAERLGHIRYFEFLKEYYNDLSDAIIRSQGDVYQYVGDEIVLTWPLKKGISRNNCLRAFFRMKEDLKKRSDYYTQKFGLIPDFKAGVHFGDVTTGEIGALKRQIFYTGDVLNTTSRIQSMCTSLGEDFIISKALVENLHKHGEFRFEELGNVELKGREEPIEILAVHQAG
jgi:adenylate cyclase